MRNRSSPRFEFKNGRIFEPLTKTFEEIHPEAFVKGCVPTRCFVAGLLTVKPDGNNRGLVGRYNGRRYPFALNEIQHLRLVHPYIPDRYVADCFRRLFRIFPDFFVASFVTIFWTIRAYSCRRGRVDKSCLPQHRRIREWRELISSPRRNVLRVFLWSENFFNVCKMVDNMKWK